MFHLKLKQLRELKKISQYELAKDLNVAQSTIGMWESNKRQPDHEMLIKVASYFDVTIDYLLLGNEPTKQKPIDTQFSSEDIALLEKINKLDERGKTLVMTIIDFKTLDESSAFELGFESAVKLMEGFGKRIPEIT